MVLSEIIVRMADLWMVFLHDPKVYFAIMGEWLLVLLYFIISEDKEGIADVYAAGVTLAFVGFELLPFYDFTFTDTTVLLSLALMGYGLTLVIFAAWEKIPNILAKILGMPSAISLPTILAVLYFESSIPIDGLTIGILAVPVIILEVVKILRQHTPL
ncbi:hypothetical protein ACFL6I_26360 [candidate division KSB1 bacterium]